MTLTESFPAPRTTGIFIRETDGLARRAEPVSFGLPLPPSRLRPTDRLRLLGPDGVPVPVQCEVTDRWPDGSARWVLLDVLVDVPARARTDFELVLDDDGPAPSAPGRLRANEADGGLFVDTGAAQFTLDRNAPAALRSVRAGGVEMLDPGATTLACRDHADADWSSRVRTLELETSGPVRATVRAEGSFARDGERALLDWTARFHFWAGRADVRIVLTVVNPRRAAHPGGTWDLGDAGSVLVRDLSLVLASASSGHVSWSPDLSAPLSESRGDTLEVYQDSSGGENWQSRVHLTRDREVPTTFCGYRVRTAGEERFGSRATPRVAVHDGTAGISASVRHFWQNFPKALEVTGNVLSVRLFPGQFSAPHEIQGGEQKTHDVWVTFGESATHAEFDFARAPLLPHTNPDWYAASGAIPYLLPRAEDGNERYGRLVDLAIEGDDSLEQKRERADEYGWRHFGETWADHESKFHEGPETFASHYNNQYDVVYGAFLQFARTGDVRWYRIMEDLARHVIDIDIYHTDEDRANFNHGLFWHTVHYVDADTSTHRSYPKNGSDGGGPDNEHNYTTGLLHYWLLSGDPLARETVERSARWVIAADDGDSTIFRWLDRGPTGHATKTREPGYHGPGRGGGNSINALLDGWRVTGDAAFLEKCDEVIRRTIHPGDDPAARRLLDAENRWSYTVHLQALGKYLDVKVQGGLLDEMYEYARESLLTYARWMAENERLILETPEQLEFPTETWPAQDVRKSDVFKFAALHAQGDERARFVERGKYFFDAALEQLDGFATKTYCRPLILLMHYGIMQAWFDRRSDDARPRGPQTGSFPPPTSFVPQRARAVAKAKRLAIVGVAVTLAGGAILLKALLF